MPLETFDNAPAYSFDVKIDGLSMPLVIEVSGIKNEVGVIEVHQQTQEGRYVVRKVPAREKPGTIDITRGLTESTAITDWLKVVMEGDLAGARKTAAVELLDYQGRVLKRINYDDVWVSSVAVSTLKAGSTEQVTEKITLQHNGRCTVE